MKVYVVMFYFQENPMLLGVFSTREKAEQLVNAEKEKYCNDAEKYYFSKSISKGVLNAYKIYEINIDDITEIYI